MNDIDMNVNDSEEITDKLKVDLDFELDAWNIKSEDAEGLEEIEIQYFERIKRTMNIKDVKGMFIQPENYFYFYGLKCMSLDISMRMRFIRQRPNAVAEMIAFNIKYPEHKYCLPEIPTYMITTKDKPIVMPNSRFFLRESDEEIEDLKHPIEKERFLGTVLYYLKTKYQIFKFKNTSQLEKYINENSAESNI